MFVRHSVTKGAPMTIFDESDRAIDSDWARRAERETRVRARRNRLFADWAAGEAGLSGAEAAARSRAWIKLDFDPRGEAALLEGVAADLGRTVEMLHPELAAFERRARDDIPERPARDDSPERPARDDSPERPSGEDTEAPPEGDTSG